MPTKNELYGRLDWAMRVLQPHTKVPPVDTETEAAVNDAFCILKHGSLFAYTQAMLLGWEDEDTEK